jgi:hypothetical protein
MTGEGTTLRRKKVWERPAAVKGYRVARRAAERLGVQVVLKTYYSPIPDLSQVPSDVFERRDPLHGIVFDAETQLRFVEERLSPYLPEFADSGADVDPRYRFEIGNGSLPEPDARVLYAMLRDLRPKRIVELGSGQTTRVIGQAIRRNAAEGAPSELRAYDPFPTAVDEGMPGLAALVREKAQSVGDEVFTSLQDGDLLFVDTTHTVKLGSDVNRIILGALPLMAPGVVVHFHDIMLPYEYPEYLMADYGLYWAEQYLLQAFLACNLGFEILCAVHTLNREHPERMVAAGAAAPGQNGSSFWLRRVAS